MMKFGGWQQCSLIDFPGKISAVLFTEGCTFRCPFCHNPSLVIPGQNRSSRITEEEVFAFLEKRRGKLDGVVISGGEPTIHADLPELIKAIKKMGFAIKLDTNGSRPEMVERLISERIVDYWAMDRKSSIARYHLLAGVSFDPSIIVTTSQMVIDSTDEYEFRTTVIRELHSPEEIVQIGKELCGARKLILQQFRPAVTLDPSFQHATAYSNEEMEHLCTSIRPYVKECYWR
jgi:pyruvate formate lyase activating enzyme